MVETIRPPLSQEELERAQKMVEGSAAVPTADAEDTGDAIQAEASPSNLAPRFPEQRQPLTAEQQQERDRRAAHMAKIMGPQNNPGPSPVPNADDAQMQRIHDRIQASYDNDPDKSQPVAGGRPIDFYRTAVKEREDAIREGSLWNRIKRFFGRNRNWRNP